MDSLRIRNVRQRIRVQQYRVGLQSFPDGTEDFLISGRHFGTAGDSTDDTQMMYLVLGQTSAVTGLFELGAMVDVVGQL